MFSKLVWKIAEISPEWGNRMMDWFPKSYQKGMNAKREKIVALRRKGWSCAAISKATGYDESAIRSIIFNQKGV